MAHHRRPLILTALIAVVALVVSLAGAASVRADDGGSGGVPGGSLPGAGGLGVASRWYDWADYPAGYPQGIESASFDWFIAKAGIPRETAQDSKFLRLQSACSTALTRSDARPGNIPGRSRVVGIMWAYTDSDPTGAWPGARGAQYFYDELANWQSSGYAGFYGKSSSAGVRSTTYNLAHAQIGETSAQDADGYVSAICVALGTGEPPLDYDLSVSTTHGMSAMTAGGTQAVTDAITTSRGGSTISESLSAKVTLNWDGFPAGGSSQRSASKTVTLSNAGTKTSPAFRPSDFGWTTWPAGRFWFDITVGKQGSMKASVDTADRLDTETRSIDPVAPEKVITTTSGTDIGDTDALSAGMTVTSRIRAYSAGSSYLSITDTVDSRDVWLGAASADDTSGIHVEDAAGKTIPADITITPTGSGKAVTAVLSPAQAPAWYTLIVPTTPKATGADYTISDDSRACWTSDASVCLSGNSRSAHKVTPAPDKAWVLDEDGGLALSDPGHTNAVGADGKIFLPGDSVSAVVTGRVAGGLADDLPSYSLTDDWTDASPYVDFSDASRAAVYLETAPGSGRFTDVTGDFDITVDGTVTTASASPAFLAGTHGQSGDRAVKLIISGSLRTDFDTDGGTVRLTNGGHETWGTETVPTNRPPVFTWTPDPDKDVIGSADQGGDQSSIEGLGVWPGQKIEYKVGLDLRIPDNLAHGAAAVTSLAVRDEYDPHFTPDRASVEFYDARTNRVIPRTQYTLAWDADNHTFTAAFTPDWVADNVSATAPDGWLILRFDGTVDEDAPRGGAVTNRAFQIINGAETATDTPIVTIPATAPHKKVLSTDGDDIDGRSVVRGDTLLYRLTLDATPSRDALAYDVHKLGLVDDYDETVLGLTADAIHVTDKATGADVTGDFNIQVSGGKAYIFAKHVDSTNLVTGRAVPGTQPEDLAAYADADISPLTDPIIDQTLLGHQYYVTLEATVLAQTEGYVITNQAVENVENVLTSTEIVSTTIRDIDPVKDVVIDPTASDSLDGQEIPLNSTFDYRLTSSTIPADRAYKASSWAITDAFDRSHDYYTGVWAVYASTDIYDGDRLVAAAGDLLADSSGQGEMDAQSVLGVTVDEGSYTLSATPTPAYLALVNSRGDLPQGFTLYVKMVRVAPGEDIANRATETYNGVERTTNTVATSTPEHPAIDVEKYTLNEGRGTGDRDSVDRAYGLTLADDYTTNADTRVGITVTNTGDVPLTTVSISDATADGTTGALTDIQCSVPDGEQSTAVPADKVSELAVGESVDCVGTLTGVEPGTLHKDTASASAESVFTGTPVADEDSWTASLPDAPGGGGDDAAAGSIGAKTGAEVSGALALAVALLGVGVACVVHSRRRMRA